MPPPNKKAKKAHKVYTPGSQPKGHKRASSSSGRGRPKKKALGRPVKYRGRYSQENLSQAVAEVQNKTMTLGEASKHFQVPKTTLHNRVKETVSDQMGRPTELSQEEEKILVERVLLLGNWGFPLTKRDLCQLIKKYLDSMGRTTRFVNNLPGKDFVKGFLGRHPVLTVRTGNMIKRSRAALSQEDVNSFFDLFTESVDGVLPEHIFNYDETNLRDNPGKK